MTASKIRFPVLSAYFKVVKKNLPSLMIYIVIFMLISVLAAKLGNNNTATTFQETKTTVAFFDSDKTQLTKGLKSSLSRNAEFSNINDDKMALSDALFYHDVEYIVRIPKGFTAKFLKGENAKICKTVGQNEFSSENIDISIERYLSTSRLYSKGMPSISQEKLVKYVKASISKETSVTTKTYGSNVNLMAIAGSYFGYLAYIFVIIIFMGISSIMMSFNGTEIKRRNLVSPLRPSSMSIQLFAGHFVFAFFVFVFGIILSLFILTPKVLGIGFIYLCLNLLCFTIVCVSISFLIGNFVRNRGAQNGIANVLGLGFAFISGIFIPQDLLSSSLLSIAHFEPCFWYVKAANEISTLSKFNFETLSPVFSCMLIQLGFAAALFAVTMAIVRQKKTA